MDLLNIHTTSTEAGGLWLRVLFGIVALALIWVVLWDVFETIVLPRRVSRPVRPSTLVYRTTWTPWAAIARRMRPGKGREDFLSLYGPLALLFLLAAWVSALLVSYAVIQWALGSAITVTDGTASFGTDLYLSATTFFTLGLGDVLPRTPLARIVTVVEAANGFALLALTIGYMPALYQAFSRREVSISMLEARAGSPPSALELLRRHCPRQASETLGELLHDWERWSAELLESHLSYPFLSYFRSQHDDQSWLIALTTILDTAALVLAGIDGIPTRQAQLTFAMARHAAVDLSQVLGTIPITPKPDRLPGSDLSRLREILRQADVQVHDMPEVDAKLIELRRMYEPYVTALSQHLLMPLPSWLPRTEHPDDWQTSATAHHTELL